MLREVLQKQLDNLQEYQKVCDLDIDEYIRLSFAIQETAAKLEEYRKAQPIKRIIAMSDDKVVTSISIDKGKLIYYPEEGNRIMTE